MLAWLHDIGILKQALFSYITFRMIIAAVVAFLVSVFLTNLLVQFFRRRSLAEKHNWEDFEHIQQFVKDGSATAAEKKPHNVAPMGGLAIIAGILGAMLLAGDLSNQYIIAGLLLMLLTGALGFADDLKKLRTKKGMSEFSKIFLGLLVTAIVLAYLYQFLGSMRELNTIWLPFKKDLGIYLGGFYAIVFLVIIFLMSNSVNITDGVDGLASGLIAIGALALGVACYIAGRADYASYLYIVFVPGVGEVAVLMAAISGACLGFLWHNASPAAVYMGDTGSLTLGALFGFAGLVSKLEVVMLIIGTLFIIEFLSSLIQRGMYKITHERFFPIAPIHHTLERVGWSKSQIVTRAYIIGIFLALLALGTLKIR